ncbi:MAG: Uma2 family endonuclease [Acidobacteriota bacterium]|nr:Uma2 family endonuclease [Acidobacteriota bacterium]
MSTAAVAKRKVQRKDFVISLPENVAECVITPIHNFTDDEFWQFCSSNRELRIEMTSEGQMMIMMPVGGEGSSRNFKLTGRFSAWVENDGSGIGFDSSGGFKLPNKAKRSPDAAWVRRERWEALNEQDRKKLVPLCPDFVVELRSDTDRLKKLQSKMEEYIANGAQLGWLIDPKEKKVHVYRPGAPVEILDHPSEVSGEPLLKGFVLKLEGIID